MLRRAKRTYKQIRSEITVFEYILWWAARILLICSIIFARPGDLVMNSINTVATFTMTIARFIGKENGIFSNLSLRCQHLINFIEVIGTFGGKLFDLYNHVPKFDRMLHSISGPIAVLGGYYILKAILKTEGGKKPGPILSACFSASFSFVVLSLWEIMEFCGDYFFGSACQGYSKPEPNDLWYLLFGMGYGGTGGSEAQFYLWDTIMDMVNAAVTTVIFSIGMYVVLRVKSARQDSLEAKALVAQTQRAAVQETPAKS